MRTMVLTRFVPLAVLGALAACTVGPDYHAPEPVLPAALAAPDGMPTAMAPVEHWWIALGDEPLSGLIDAALAGSPDLASAEARVQQARAQARVTGRPGGRRRLIVAERNLPAEFGQARL